MHARDIQVNAAAPIFHATNNAKAPQSRGYFFFGFLALRSRCFA